MKTVVIQRPFTNSEGRWIKAGTLLQLPDDEASRLVREGLAQIRVPIGPTETKGEA